MSEPKEFDKGDRAAIVGGKKGLGVRGTVFWKGENKWGEGLRYGLKGDDGETYWLDEKFLGDEAGAPPAPEVTAPAALDKGDRVEIVKGSDQGVAGTIFWVGDSKFGPGKRYGIKGEDDETYWADGTQVKALEGEPSDTGDGEATDEPGYQGGAAPDEDAPFPGDIDAPDEAPFEEEEPPF
ncbi:MAG: hypothetical protein AAGF12_04310 [Myxococcota bacterium]